MVDVAKVEPHGVVPDAQLAGSRLAGIMVLPFENLGPSVFMDDNGFRHDVPPQMILSKMSRLKIECPRP